MPQITIDGQVIEAQDGQMIIEAAQQAGIVIPHFCWHPGLTVAGNCRMCLVDAGMPRREEDGTIATDENGEPIINWGRKLAIACATPIADGMHVRMDAKHVLEAQNAVMEFLLINHPLDCPICDEAGQCKLQEYAFLHSKGESRFTDEKVHKDKRRPLGPNVLFDAERCISCSRCIRFADEYCDQPALTFAQRGDRVTIETFPDKEFDSPYAMNVIDICPVGALTSPDFRFKARVWDMSFNDSICTGCSRGCNIQVGVRNNEILRLEPRNNMQVNEYWMCDHGRLNQFQFVNQDRIDKPLLRGEDGSLREVEWKEAVAAAAARLKGIAPYELMVLGSAHGSNENNYLLHKFATELLKTNNIDYIRHDDPAFGDDKLRRNDRTPNRAGLKAIGFEAEGRGIGVNALVDAINGGRIKALYVMEDDLSALSDEAVEALDKLTLLIVHASNHNATSKKADIVFSAATYAELEGSYTNFQGRVQHLAPAIVTGENERRMGMKMSRLDKFGAFNDRWTQGERRNCRTSWLPILQVAMQLGADWTYHKVEDIFDEMAQKLDGFQGMSYDLLQKRRGVIIGQADQPETLAVEYESHFMKPN